MQILILINKIKSLEKIPGPIVGPSTRIHSASNSISRQIQKNWVFFKTSFDWPGNRLFRFGLFRSIHHAQLVYTYVTYSYIFRTAGDWRTTLREWWFGIWSLFFCFRKYVRMVFVMCVSVGLLKIKCLLGRIRRNGCGFWIVFQWTFLEARIKYKCVITTSVIDIELSI